MTFEEKEKLVLSTTPVLVQQLAANTQPLWGRMTPHHMVEHLTGVMRCSNGRFNVPVKTPAEKLSRYHEFLMSDTPFKPGTVSPALGSELQPLRTESLEAAVDKLLRATEAFTTYFDENPDAKPNHPAFGPLTRTEWIQFHAKHAVHHLAQFGLLPLPQHPLFAEYTDNA